MAKMTEHEFCMDILRELIEIQRNQDFPEDFRLEIRERLLDLKDELERIILLYQ